MKYFNHTEVQGQEDNLKQNKTGCIKIKSPSQKENKKKKKYRVSKRKSLYCLKV